MLATLLFCESLVFHHEYVSAATSFVYLGLGYFGWYHHVRASSKWTTLFAWMMVTGIGSAWLHFTQSIVAGYMDVGSMFFLIYASLGQVIYCILHMIFVSHEPVSPVSEPSSLSALTSSSSSYHRWLEAVSAGFHMAQLALSLLSLALYYNTAGLQLTIVFGIPAAMLWIMLCIWSLVLYKQRYKLPYRYAVMGLCLAGFATLIWMQTETRCTGEDADPDWIPYLFGHAWWHILLSFASYYLIIFTYFVYLKLDGIDPMLAFPACGCQWLPVVQY